MEKINELIEILLEEDKLYKQILELANKKTNFIAQDNIEQIQNITRQEEQFIQDARILEYKREDKIIETQKQLKIQKIQELNDILNYIEEPNLKKQLKDTKQEFAKTLKELKTINDLNNTLIKDALEYINLSINLMTAASVEPTYGKGAGELETQTQGRNFFDTKG